MGTKENTTGNREQRPPGPTSKSAGGPAPASAAKGTGGASPAGKSSAPAAKSAAAAPTSIPAVAEVDPDELVRRAEGQRGLQAAETLLSAALAFRRRPDVVAAVHCLERGLGELQEQIETPPAARLGAELEFQLGILCEEELGRFEDALVHFQTAFKLRPDNLEPLRRGRGIYQSLGDMDMVARLIELHLANLVANETKSGVALALELGQLKLRLNDPAGAVEALRGALRMHNDSSNGEEVPEPLLSTLADAYVSPDYQPGMAEKDQARRHASEIYLSLAKRSLDPKQTGKTDGEGDSKKGDDSELRESERKAIHFLKKALEADARNVTAAGLLETLYGRLPMAQRASELIKLYKSGARVSRRGPKLRKLYEESGIAIDYGAIIDACRTGLDAVNSVEEWTETRDTMKQMLEKSGDLFGLAALREEDASEAALPEERAELLMQAADLYQRGGDQERHIACLKQAFHELPLHADAFRKLNDFYKSRRDFIGLAVLQEARMAAQFETAKLDLASYAKQLEELAELYERKLQDVASAAAIWRRIDELLPSARSQSERKRLAQRLSRIDQQVRELQIELERLSADQVSERVELLRRLGQLFRELHEPKHAAAVYEELLGLSTDLPSIKILIELREQSGDVPGQLDLLRQQAGLVTDRAERLSLLRRMMALCDQRMLQRGESIDAQDSLGMTIWVCRALLTELPNDRDALKRLSDALQLLGNKSELVDVLEAYLKVAPTPREKLGLHRQIAKISEDNEDLARTVSHLERAVRICPPGPESEEVLCELARVYGRQGRTELAVQTLELCLKQNPRAGAELQRLLGRLTQESDDAVLLDKSVRAFRELLSRVPDDAEALASLQRLFRRRGEWAELKAVLERQLATNDPPLPLRDRLSVALELSEVYSEHLKDLRGAAALIERVQAETPIVDLRVHRRLRVLNEELGEYSKAARYAERELLLTEDPVARMERAFEIATMWQSRAKDNDRALLAYERVLQIAPELPNDAPEAANVRLIVLQALEAMGQMFIAAGRWSEVVLIGQRRLSMAIDQGEVVPAAMILIELAQIYEEKLSQPADGFALRRQAFELAPHVVSLDQLSELAGKFGLWRELCDLHAGRVEQAIAAGEEPPVESALAATAIFEKQLQQPLAAFRLLQRTLPHTPQVALAASTPGTAHATILTELRRLVGAYGVAAKPDDSEVMEGVTIVRELQLLYRELVDELCRLEQAGSEEIAVRLHQLLGASARLREEVNKDVGGALSDRMHAFTVAGERDHSRDAAADAVFAETMREIHRLAALSNQIKEAIAIDNRRMERAGNDLRKQQIACDHAAWLDEQGGDLQRALKACLKALSLCEEGSDAQAEMRGRLVRLGQKLGLLAWDEIARAERSMAGSNPRVLQKRLVYLASLWQHCAGDYVRALDAAGQAYRLCFFPSGLPQGAGAKSGPPLSELVLLNPDADQQAEQRSIRAVLDRIALSAPNDSEGNAKLTALLDSLTNQLNEAGASTLAALVQLDAAQVDERRSRLSQAERRYLDITKNPQMAELATQQLERLYRQQRRFNDLAAQLEKRRTTAPASAQYGILLDLAELYRETNKYQLALNSLSQALSLNAHDDAPYALQARIFEAQRMWPRAVEAYQAAAQRAQSGERAARSLLGAAELCERKLNQASEALDLYRAALGHSYSAQSAAIGKSGKLDPLVITDRDTAWAGAERLLRSDKALRDLRALDALYVDRLSHTPQSEVDERAGLLQQRLDLLAELRGSADKSSGDGDADKSAIVQTIRELAMLRPQEDELLAKLEDQLRSLQQLSAARDIARLRAQGAAARGADVSTQAERWLHVSEQALALPDLRDAEAALNQALKLAPDSVVALRAYAALKEKTGQAEEHVAALLRVAQAEPRIEDAVRAELQAASVLLNALRDSTRARQLVAGALQRAQASRSAAAVAAAHWNLFELERDAGEMHAASEAAKQALAAGTVGVTQAAELHEFLGLQAQERGDTKTAQQHLEAALGLSAGRLQATRALTDILQSTQAHARIDELVREALKAASENADEALDARLHAELLRKQGSALQALGRLREGYDALHAAEDLLPGDLPQQIQLGEAAFALREYPIAAQYLGGLLAYAGDASLLPSSLTRQQLSDGLDHAAVAERALQCNEQARQLWQAALRVQPDHAASAEHYLDLLLEQGDAADSSEAQALLIGRAERAAVAGDGVGAVRAYLRAADLAREISGDTAAAHALLMRAYAIAPGIKRPRPEGAEEASGIHSASQLIPLAPEQAEARSELLNKLLASALSLSLMGEARTYAEALAEISTLPDEKSTFLRQAADCALREGQSEIGKGLLLKALRYAPGDLDLLSKLAPLFDDSEAASMLGAMLVQSASTMFQVPSSTPATPEEPRERAEQRVQLWRHLAGVQVRLGELEAAAQSYDQALAVATRLSPAIRIELRRAALDVVEGSSPERAREHLRALLDAQGLERELLSRLQALEEQAGQSSMAARIAQVLRLLEQASGATLTSAAGLALPAIPAGLKLDDTEHARWAVPEARHMADVFAALWDGIVGLKAPQLDSFGVAGNDRVVPSETSPDDVARSFAVASRVLGNQRSSMYRVGWQQFVLPRVSGRMPAGLIVSPGLAKHGLGDVQFILSRAVESLRPEYILAMCLPPRELTQLLGLAVRGFHPRHARTAGEDVAAWKRELPYRTVKRLGEVFRDLGELSFSSVAWRRAVRRTLQRTAVLISGDLLAAANVLRTLDLPIALGSSSKEEAQGIHLRFDNAPRGSDAGRECEADIRDLCSFFIDPQMSALFDRLHPPTSST